MNITALSYMPGYNRTTAIREEEIFTVPETLNLLPGVDEEVVVYRGLSHDEVDLLHAQARDERRVVEFHLSNVSSWTKSYPVAEEYGFVFRTTVSRNDVLVDTTKIKDFVPQVYHTQQHEVIMKPGVYRCVECESADDCGALEGKKRRRPLVLKDDKKRDVQDFDFYTAQVLFFETFAACTDLRLDPFAAPQHWVTLSDRQSEPVEKREDRLPDDFFYNEMRAQFFEYSDEEEDDFDEEEDDY